MFTSQMHMAAPRAPSPSEMPNSALGLMLQSACSKVFVRLKNSGVSRSSKLFLSASWSACLRSMSAEESFRTVPPDEGVESVGCGSLGVLAERQEEQHDHRDDQAANQDRKQHRVHASSPDAGARAVAPRVFDPAIPGTVPAPHPPGPGNRGTWLGLSLSRASGCARRTYSTAT